MSYQKLQSGKAKVVTPSDTVNIFYANAGDNQGNVLYIGTGGDLRVLTVSGDDIVFTNIQDGTFLPIQVLRVFSTNTTALNIVALW
jgi:hypothetical protein